MNKLTIDQYLTDLASEKPAPGGGAAVAFCAAQGTALLSMVLAISGENPDKLPVKRYKELVTFLAKSNAGLVELANKDASAFEGVMAGFQLPKNTDEEKKKRKNALQAAYKNATEVPFSTMELIAEILDSAENVVSAGKTSVISDAAIGIEFLYSSLKACRHNVRINLKYIQDESFREAAESRMKNLTSGRNKQRKAMLEKIQEMMTSR